MIRVRKWWPLGLAEWFAAETCKHLPTLRREPATSECSLYVEAT